MPLEDIIIYKNYQIVLLRMDSCLKSLGDYVNGYVYLDKLHELDIPEGNLPFETYRDGNIVGIDTAHYNNEHMTYEQRREDAIFQIKSIINEYEKMMSLKK